MYWGYAYVMTKYTPQDLIAFEERVCESFKNKEIRAPVHLYHGNEKEMIALFDNIRDQDWVFCTWRSHYQCLLKGVPPDRLLEDIKQGRSIALNYPEYRILSSAIVTGNIPIANGVALAIKRQGLDEHVCCFVGDMTAETGCFFENWKYALNFNLPITFIVEDNGKSVCTDTRKAWGTDQYFWESAREEEKIVYYKYETKYPHAGTGERIQF
jgi:TPP-dependent pyruvate/acetoin dehydrogenase alpha subunit